MSLYTGIDVGKFGHVAALLSHALLSKHHGRYEACPIFPFDQSRTSFEKLFAVMTSYAPPQNCHVLLENTGHYGRALEQFLQEKGVQVYQISVQREKKGKQKSDKRDAQALAVLLFNQIEKHILVADKSQIAYRLVPPSDTARLLRGLVQHRHELVRETTQRRNQLTAICDELFPELTEIYADPNNPSALRLREKYPTPESIASASLEDLIATRIYRRPSKAKFAQLQDLAKQTIGTKDKSRITCLLMEQTQLMKELHLLDEHVEQLNAAIDASVVTSREGRILTSFPIIGPTHAATLIACIGSIANFESEAKLRTYCGWSPLQSQTGISKDSMTLEQGGNRLLKHTIYLVTLQAIHMDTPWKALYNRLVPLKAVYDERTKKWHGRMKVIGRIAGQIIGVIYVLLKRDYLLLQHTSVGEEPKEPELYDASRHQVKR